MCRVILLCLAALFLITTSCKHKETKHWSRLSSAQHHFSILMPGTPSHDESVTNDSFSYWVRADNAYFSIEGSKSVVKFSDDPEWFFDSYRRNSVVDSGVKLLSDQPINLKGHHGHEFTFNMHGDTLHIIRLYVIGDYLYRLNIIVVSPDEIKDEEVEKFFSSFDVS